MVSLLNPLTLAMDRLYDSTIRERFLKGAEFSEPAGDPGWFGPDSPVWYVHAHTGTLVLGLFASAAIEGLHPDFAWMGEDHSRALKRVDGQVVGQDLEGTLIRAGHSFSFFMSVAYGSTSAAERVTSAVKGMHHRVRGIRPDGRAYDADDPETLRWAYATVVWGIAEAHERYHLRPLRGADLDAYYGEFVRVGEALGGTDLPATKRDVADYLEASVPLMGVTRPVAQFYDMLDPRRNRLALYPFLSLFQWAVLDLQPSWARQLLRVSPTSRLETIARRAAMKSLLNGLHYGSGGMREEHEARARVARPSGAHARVDRKIDELVLGDQPVIASTSLR